MYKKKLFFGFFIFVLIFITPQTFAQVCEEKICKIGEYEFTCPSNCSSDVGLNLNRHFAETNGTFLPFTDPESNVTFEAGLNLNRHFAETNGTFLPFTDPESNAEAGLNLNRHFAETNGTFLPFTDPESNVTFILETTNNGKKTLRGAVDKETKEVKHVDTFFEKSENRSTRADIKGLTPNKKYHVYKDSYENHENITTDGQGSLSFEQDTSDNHHTWLQEEEGHTVYIRDREDCANSSITRKNYGVYDNTTRTCTLTSDITESVEILVNNITLDCAGYNVRSNIRNYYGTTGILLNSKSNVFIKNCRVSGFNYGIYLSGSNNILKSNNANNNSNGIYLYYGANNTLDSNNANNNGYYGIFLNGAKNNTLASNNANNNSYAGIYLSGTNNILASNNANNNEYYGISLSGTNNILASNNVNNNEYYGISLEYGENNILESNNVNNNSLGIYLYGANSNTIYNNLFNNIINAQDDEGFNIWNIDKTPGKNIVGGSFFGGNFWHDYNGTDLDGDGLGDTELPYNSKGNILSGGDMSPLIPGNQTTEPIVIALPANLHVSKWGATAVPGRILDYYIVVTNIGGEPAENVRVSEVIDPTLFTLESTSPSASINENTSAPVITWSFALAPKELKLLRYNAKLNASTPTGIEVIGGPVMIVEGGDIQESCASIISPNTFGKDSVGKEPHSGYCEERNVIEGEDCDPAKKRCFHYGYDYEKNYNDLDPSVKAVYDGKVIDIITPWGPGGSAVWVKTCLEHMPCFVTSYGHITPNPNLEEGDNVTKFEVVGNAYDINEDGTGTGDHLDVKTFWFNGDGDRVHNYNWWETAFDMDNYELDENGKGKKTECDGTDRNRGATDAINSCYEKLCKELQIDCDTAKHNQTAVRAVDPNEKGVAQERYIKSNQELSYPVRFENIGEEVEAKDVFITDTLDNNINISTVNVFSQAQGFMYLPENSTVTLLEQEHTRTIIIDDQEIQETFIEKWTAHLNSETRTIKWELININLEPGATDNVVFFVKPLAELSSGTEIRNKATIQFEVFETIETNEVLNIIDEVSPECIMDTLPDETNSLNIPLTFSGTDVGSKIEFYRIFASTDRGEYGEIIKTEETSAVFRAEEGKQYDFICIAQDLAGNIESQPAVAEASTRVIVTDADGDGIFDFEDNCAEISNPRQEDFDGDGLGDLCDNDADGDGVLNADDRCPVEDATGLDANKNGCVDNLNSLIDEVNNLGLNRGITNSLTTKLENAKRALESENSEQRNDAINKIEAFINEVEAQRLGEGQASMLVAMANNFMTQLFAAQD